MSISHTDGTHGPHRPHIEDKPRLRLSITLRSASTEAAQPLGPAAGAAKAPAPAPAPKAEPRAHVAPAPAPAPKAEPRAQVAPAPAITTTGGGLGQSIWATSHLRVPLAAVGSYSDLELAVLHIFGILVQTIVVDGQVWMATVHGLGKAQAAIRDYRAGIGENPTGRKHLIRVSTVRVPWVQPCIGPEQEVLYAALGLDTVNFFERSITAVPTIHTVLLDYVSEVRARLAKSAFADIDAHHEAPLTTLGLLEYYVGPPPQVIRTLAAFCGVPYCRVFDDSGQIYWIAALDGAAVGRHVQALGLATLA